MIFYFSGTGNSQWVANEIARALSESIYSIADLMCDAKHNKTFELTAEESIGFIFPIHSWGPPAIVVDFMRLLQLHHYQRHYLYMVCTCGDETGYAPSIVIEKTANKGWKWEAIWSLVMPNNYVLLPGFDVDSKEIESLKLKESSRQLQLIIPQISRQQRGISAYYIGKFPLLKSRFIYPLFCKYAINAKPFYTTDQCNGCKKCEHICPTHNIKVGAKPQWGELCTCCTACFHICPQQAIQYGSVTRKKHQYLNPNITNYSKRQ